MFNRSQYYTSYAQESARSSSLDLEIGTVGNIRYKDNRGGQCKTSKYLSHPQRRQSVPTEVTETIQWFLLPKTSLSISFRLTTEQSVLVGSSCKCDITIQSPTVEKRHAVLAFQPNTSSFAVKDLKTTNGTYLNNRRISADHPETVSNLDQLRFGYDPTLYEIRSASLTAVKTGDSTSSGPSSLPNYSSPANFTYAGERVSRQHVEHKLPSVSNKDNNLNTGPPTPPKASPFSPSRKSLLAVTKSDPWERENKTNTRNTSGILFSDRVVHRRHSNNSGGTDKCYKSGCNDFPAGYRDHDQHSGSNSQTDANVMQQGGRIGANRVCSPSLTLDSGRGSSSAPSSPAKEMSPVQMITSAATATANSPCTSGMAANTAASASSSHTASPVFARKLSRPMEYLLGQQADQEQGEPGYVPDPPSGHSSGNFTSLCSDPLSFGMGASGNYNHHQQLRNNEHNNNNHGYSHLGDGGSGTGDCEILQITEDYESNEADSGEMVARKDSLEEEENRAHKNGNLDGKNVMLVNSDGGSSVRRVQPQFIVGGDIMQPDLNVPNEIFGPLSHAEILSRNISSANSSCSNTNLNSQHSSGKQGNNKPVDINTNSPVPHARARSSSGDGGGSNRSTPLSALYGTPHWWPDSPPEENCCPPPPVSSTNTSPFKKPYLLNNSTTCTTNSSSATASNRLKENSPSCLLEDHIKDLSLESTHSHKSHSSPATPPPSAGATGSDMAEAKKFVPMAFTIDFSDNETAATEAAEAKKAAMAERLSKFAPRHRKNASSTKSDDVVGAKEGESFSLSSSSSSSKQNAKSSSNSLNRAHHHLRQSTATAAESSSKSSSLPKRFSGGGIVAASTKHPSGGSSNTNNNDSGLRSLSPETISSTTSSSSRSRPLPDSKSSLNTPKVSRDREAATSMTRKSNRNSQSRGGTPASRRTPVADGIKASTSRAAAPLNDLSKVTPVAPQASGDNEDNVSEAGTYTVEKDAPEAESARENIEEVFGLTEPVADCVEDLDKENNLNSPDNKKSFFVEPGTRDWVREWALAAQQHQQKQRPELPDSQYFLRETENLVTAIQERVSKHMKSGGGSTSLGAAGSDSEDEPTLAHHSPLQSQSQQSTPINSGRKCATPRTSPFHRESSVLSDSGVRRGRPVGYDSDLTTTKQLLMMNQQSLTLPVNSARGVSPKPQASSNKYSHGVGGTGSRSGLSGVSPVNKSSSPLFSRNDGGRFSLRMPKSRTPPAQMPPPAPRHNSYTGAMSGAESHGVKSLNGHVRPDSHTSNHSGSTKKPAYAGKVQNASGGGGSKKPSGNRSNSTLTAKEVELANWKRRKNYDPMKAAAEGKKTRKNGASSSGAESGMEENVTLPAIASPKVNRREAMMTKSLSFHQESYSPKCGSEDEEMIYIVDEMDSSHSNSPNHLGMTRSYHEDSMYYGMSQSGPSTRSKNKLEALDNLVIATIHSLSNKVRTSSRHLLEKLQTQHTNDENGALLEEMVSQLKELEGPSSNTSPNKSPSRELSGTLKNLKKLEQVILVLDKVLCDEFESDMNG